MLNKIIYTILGFGLAFVFFPHAAKDSARGPIISGASTSAHMQSVKSAPELAATLEAPNLRAKAAVAVDLDSGSILYSRNLDEKLPIASLTKLMTALVVVKSVDTKSIVTIEKKDQTVIGSTIGLVEGEQITVHELLRGMLIPSGNDAALTLANYVGGNVDNFAATMNEEAAKLGLVNTHFSNPVGWDSDENYSNALDLVKIVRELMQSDELAKIVATKEADVSSVDGRYSHKVTSTNKLLLQNPEVIGVKTGFTSKALGNLIILSNHNDRKILTIVLGSEDREGDSQQLMDWLFAVYRW